jgi:AcrR family transcriptional regulator
MAKRTTRSKRSAPESKDTRQAVIDAALSLAEAGRWRDLSLADIADAAEVPLAELYRDFTSKQAILSAYSRNVDARVLAGRPADLAEEPARDRLFDVIMRRLDAMKGEKAGLATVVQDSVRDPLTALCGACQLRRSMAAMLEAAGLASDGLRGRLRIKGLAAIYLTTLRVWFKDDNEDLGKTMAKLDAALRCADRMIGRFPGRGASVEN